MQQAIGLSVLLCLERDGWEVSFRINTPQRNNISW